MNEIEQDKAVSAALKCMTSFVSEANAEQERQLITKNLNLDALLGIKGPYFYNSYGEQRLDLDSDKSNSAANLLDSYYLFSSSMKCPG